MHEELEAILDIQFHNPNLLTLALTHRSYIYEAAGEGRSSNERLEFLGDSILALISADFLYRTFPDLAEGELTDARAVLVRTETLANFARDINLSNFLLMGKGEQHSGGGQRVLASAFEALLGAIYLDQGLDAVQTFLLKRLEPLAHTIVRNRLFKDNKSLFQELAQAHDGITPSYRLVNQEGPSHNREFTIEVLLGEQVAGRGQGRNKQSAEQEAARQALLSRGWIS
ncbi:ribonuclease 3 [Ktedonobacter sp. SOSP1-85]|jgi:ribonuclease-3|uniref:Ribonuclease 3 n=2 Tax=Ktedonobacter TaxID=363276 RepID=D6TIW0_KTERA|nr:MULTISPECIES: ribonuclease III [Ktedonobacter]EFH89367.1 ribonuclease III [Ktedonobacter racemifer DSM 44963]GHO54951.1 ribonuclease 3 [Ktedonobacter robiniae]GHO67324.1 ribonuclease 3 [Ktedonobacter sp. SOSP1-52]GHO73405.1 ribonuclease 3 [Ktedonobacter sp. SOSP1-85]